MGSYFSAAVGPDFDSDDNKMHNRYFPTFDALTQAVEAGLGYFQTHPAAVKQLMGSYLDEKAACPQAA